MDEKTQFLASVESFLEYSGMKPTPFGIAAVNDPAFVFDLRKGRSCNFETAMKVREYIRNFRPPDGSVQ